MNGDDATLIIDHVTKHYGEFVAVDDLNLIARRGRIFGLLGPNGAGKTTTIRMIVNIIAPDSGTIKLLGQQIDAKLQDRIGYLPEERGLYKKMRIGEQLRFFGQLKNLSARRADEAITRWLAKFNLSEWRDKKADELSKGMQQKVQLIAAIMHEPELIILDEPFSGLDPVSAQLLQEAVLELKDAGRTIIFSTHQMEQAEKMCDDICLINRSRRVLGGTLREVKERFGRNAVALRAEGVDGNTFNDSTLIESVRRNRDEWEILLAKGADPQDLLQYLVSNGARVAKFERVQPSLHDIFVSEVGRTAI